MDTYSSVFEDSFLHLISTFICLAHWWTCWRASIFNNLELEKTTQILVFFPLYAPQKLLSTFWNFPLHFPPVQSKIWCTCALLSSLPSSRYVKMTNGTPHTWHYSTITRATLFQGGNDSADRTLHAPSSRSFLASVIWRELPKQTLSVFQTTQCVIFCKWS